MKYEVTRIENDYIITYKGRDYKRPLRTCSFAFDTENIIILDGKVVSVEEMREALKDCPQEEQRKRLASRVWAWQVYDEVNGFFMSSNFNYFCEYCCKAGLKYGWCYNATFDFSQIDYAVLSNSLWQPHERAKENQAYNKNQPYTYESLHNAQGARYAYKLWYPYKNKTRHNYTHSFELRDFMKFSPAGLKRLLEDLDVQDNEGNELRKLTMEYQNVEVDSLTNEQIAYCENDVKGLYFAIKKFNEEIEKQSNGESHVFGKNTNLMTAGGFAKRELLRNLYPNIQPKYRLEKYQRAHPLTFAQDNYFRDNHLYRGGISYVNPRYKGVLCNGGRKLRRYDVNSEYPYIMANIDDLVGKPKQWAFNEWLKVPDKSKYISIYEIGNISGELLPNMVGLWYSLERYEYVDNFEEETKRLIFEEELQELSHFYNLEYQVYSVITFERGGKIYANFVNENYALKAEAKVNKNRSLEKIAKLKLNSSYGKLAERLERAIGHYEINADTGAVHFVQDGVEADARARMSVAVGAYITAKARCYIMSKIREICPNPSKDFLYIDTDSIHCFCDYDKADAYELGALKLEATCDACKYLLPKTYIDIEQVLPTGEVPKIVGKAMNFELHTKGVNVTNVASELVEVVNLTIEYIDNRINYGEKFPVLLALNVVGGKVLVPTYKYLARPEQAPQNIVIRQTEAGQYYEEL